jgi:predicted ATPase
MTALSIPTSVSSFGEMLHYLRRQARLSQRELAIAVGYSESMISRLEHDERPPDVATIHALFVPALHLERQPETVARLIELATTARNGAADEVSKPQANAKQRRPLLRRSLPLRLASFVGREQDVRKLARLVAEKRLVTLTGPGGCGKTSLAVETCRWLAGADMAGAEAGAAAGQLLLDELCLVELYPISDPDLLAQAVLTALGSETSEQQPALETLMSAIQGRRVLLVLDNCEHLVGDAARFVRTLLQGCPNLRVIATSRERLSIAGETVYAVPPLPCPNSGHPPKPAEMLEYPAVQLFVRRCEDICADFRLTPQNAGSVAQICTMLDGIPLALELGAAATATFSVQEIARRLYAHVPPPEPGLRPADPRHASIDDTVGWSYNLLAPAEQQVLAMLSVFVGGWTAEAMQCLCADEPACIGILHQLVQKSLVNVGRSESPSEPTRYNLLRAVREYASAQLAGSEQEMHARRRHFEYYVQLGVTLGGQVLGPQHRRAMADLDAEHANIRAALACGQTNADMVEPYTRLAAALVYYWRRRGYVAESLAWLAAPLAGNHTLSLATNALAHAAVLYETGSEPYCFSRGLQGNKELLRLAAEAEALVRLCLEQHEQHAAALLMLAVGALQDDQSNAATSADYARLAWSILDELGDQRGAALAGNLLARSLLVLGRLDAASRMQEQILAALENNGMSWCLCEAYWLQSYIAQQQHGRVDAWRILQRTAKIAEEEEFVAVIHDVYLVLEHLDADKAVAVAEQLVARQRQRSPSAMLCLALHQLGRMYLNMGRYALAQEVLDEALQLYPRLSLSLREPPGPQWSLIDRGQVARLQGEAELAVACFDESIRLFRATPFPYMCVAPLLFRGQVFFEQNDIGAALVDFRSCLRVALQDPSAWADYNVLNCFAGIAEVARRRGAAAVAGKLYANAAVMQAEWSAAGHYSQPHVAAFYDRVMAAVPDYRQDSAFDAAWQEGAALALEDAVQLALAW